MNSLWMIQYRLGHIHVNLGNEHQALTYFQTSITTLEQMRSYLKLPELQRLFMQKNLNPYQEMIRLLLKHGKYEQALLYLERFKARTFLEMAAYGEPQLHRVPELIQEEQYLSARIRFLAGRFSSFDNSSPPNTLEDDFLLAYPGSLEFENLQRLRGSPDFQILQQAVEEYRVVVSIEPGNKYAANNLGVALAELDRSEEAEGVLREALRLDVQDFILFNLALVLRQKYQKIQHDDIQNEIVGLLEQYLQFTPYDDVAREYLQEMKAGR